MAPVVVNPDNVREFRDFQAFYDWLAEHHATAEVVCVTTDAFVMAASDGSGMLIRTGLRPGSVEVERNPEKVRAFLVERGYRAE